MKEKIFFLNFWPKGGMKHYSDAIVKLISRDMKVKYINNYNKNINLNPFNYNNYLYLAKIKSRIKMTNPSVIHINSGYPFLLLLYPFFSKYNSVITLHDAKLHEGESLLKKIYHKIHLYFIYKFIDKIIVHSEKIKSELPGYFKEKQIFIMPHVNYNHLAQIKKVKRDSRFTLLFFGRILPYKGLKYLIDAFIKLPEKDYKLIIAGEGKIDCKIPEQENIKVINRFVSDEEMQSLFSKSDISVLPYISASQSGVAYLSFAFNKPVIATNVGAIPDVVKNNVNGLLIKPKSSEELLKAIKTIRNKKRYDLFVKNIKNQNESNDKMILRRLEEIYNDKTPLQ